MGSIRPERSERTRWTEAAPPLHLPGAVLSLRFTITQSLRMQRYAQLAAVLGALSGIGLAALMALAIRPWAHPAAGSAWAAVALSLLLGAAWSAVPVLLTAVVMDRVTETERQVQGMIATRPLFGLIPPSLGGWAIDPHFANVLVRTLVEARPRTVVECGSGSSTVLSAAFMREQGEGRVFSLDHEPDFAEKTRQMLRDRGLDGWATVIAAPLEEHPSGEGPMLWYGTEFDGALPESIDLLVVDGPPRHIGPESRHPAVPLLLTRLSADATVLMDDGNRPDEVRIARRWAAELRGTLEYVPGGKGAWLIRRGAPAS